MVFVQPTPTMVLRHDRSKKVFSHTLTHTTRHGFRHGLMEGGARHGTCGLEAWIPIWFKYSIFCACRDPCFLVFGGRASSLMRGGIAGNARSLRPQQLRLRRRNDIIMAPLRNEEFKAPENKEFKTTSTLLDPCKVSQCVYEVAVGFKMDFKVQACMWSFVE